MSDHLSKTLQSTTFKPLTVSRRCSASRWWCQYDWGSPPDVELFREQVCFLSNLSLCERLFEINQTSSCHQQTNHYFPETCILLIPLPPKEFKSLFLFYCGCFYFSSNHPKHLEIPCRWQCAVQIILCCLAFPKIVMFPCIQNCYASTL